MASVITPGPISQMVIYTGLLSTAVMVPVIVPVGGNTSSFNNYRIPAASFGPSSIAPTIITTGATLASPYAVSATETQILFNKTVGTASGALLPNSTTRQAPVLIKDIKGDADTNNISVTFTAGQSCDGLTTYPILLPYGGVWFSPLAAGGWFVSS